MTASPPLLDDARIDPARVHSLPASVPDPWLLEIVEATGSTNADLAAHLKTLSLTRDALPKPIVRVAYEQTAGRGRQGRPWFALPGNALLCSVGCVLPSPVNALAGLSLAVGVALAEGLGNLPLRGQQVRLKWPNDLLLSDGEQLLGKLGGILVETVWNTAHATVIVIGFGINVRGTEAVVAEVDALRARDAALAGALPPAALSSACPSANLTDTLATVLDPLATALEHFAAVGLAPFRSRWAALHAYPGREVVLLEQGRELARGIATGIDEQGQLLLDTAEGVRTIATGDVSLRLSAAEGGEAQ
ncbi:MAG: biotin--[acetyl-CoA-carboxylase] ligase [Burkholderia sp.]